MDKSTHGKMVDLGRERPRDIPQAVEPRSGKDYDSITVDGDDFPYLCEQEIGHECEVVVKVRVTGIREPGTYEKDRDESGPKVTLEIISMSAPNSKKMTDKELEERY